MLLHDRDRNALLLGSIVIVIAFALFRGLPAWSRWRIAAATAAIETSHALQDERRRMALLPAALDSFDRRLDRMRELGAVLFVGDDLDQVAASLQDVLEEAARIHDVQLHATDIRTDTTAALNLHRIAADIRATAEVRGLAAFLHELEGPPRLLAVRRLSIRPEHVGARPDELEVLHIRASIEALTLLRDPATATVQ